MSEETNKGFWDDANVISSYSRVQAVEDGALVDLTPWAKEAGFKFPVAITRAAWIDFIEWPENKDARNMGQSERGRAHDVLMVLLFTIRASDRSGSQLDFKVSRIPYQGGRHARPGCLKSICGPGGTPEPVITIMLPEED